MTYIPLRRGFLYLVAIMDWASRRVLAWRLSNTLDVTFCVAALEDALAGFGVPEIFNTDQGSQFTSLVFTGRLEAAGIRISMDGKGRWMDNVFIERLWRSLKYECVYLNAFETGSQARAGIGLWIEYPASAFGVRRADAQRGLRGMPAGVGGSMSAAFFRWRRPVDMWTIRCADRLRFPQVPPRQGTWGNARLRPHTHRPTANNQELNRSGEFTAGHHLKSRRYLSNDSGPPQIAFSGSRRGIQQIAFHPASPPLRFSW